MGMVNQVPQEDLENLRGRELPPGIPLYDSEEIEDLCKRWVSFSGSQRENILWEAGFQLYKDGERRELIVHRLAMKCLTELSDPVDGWRRMTNSQIRRAWELVSVTPIHP